MGHLDPARTLGALVTEAARRVLAGPMDDAAWCSIAHVADAITNAGACFPTRAARELVVAVALAIVDAETRAVADTLAELAPRLDTRQPRPATVFPLSPDQFPGFEGLQVPEAEAEANGQGMHKPCS